MPASVKGVALAVVSSLAVALGGCGGQLPAESGGAGGGGAGGGGQTGAVAGHVGAGRTGAGGAQTLRRVDLGRPGLVVGPVGGGVGGAGGANQGCPAVPDRGFPFEDEATEQRFLQLADGVTTLRFTTVAAFANQDPNINVTVTDPVAAREACRATITLPVMPQGTYNCPSGYGVSYHLACFDRDPTSGVCPVIAATIHPGECQTATISDGTDTLARWSATASGYWQTLAADLGVTVDALFSH